MGPWRKPVGWQKEPYRHYLALKGIRTKKKTDFIHGGLADKSAYASFDPEQLRKGTEVELEHTNDRKIAREIASDHLKEFGNDYYIELEKMERKLARAK